MEDKTIAGVNITLNEEGYLTDPEQWNEDVAKEIAQEEEIELSDKHFEVLNYLREQFLAGESLSIRKVGNSGIVNIKELYQLFPGGPLKKSSRIAGIPKPASCV
ncbi:MAG: TusE/DsrC/DsvC family sulfur relay protein [Bacteroidales bacterium]|nr:TusE/DsrC/DsvC family sulfur relay protein [Bacteroidales bacterium]MCK5338597.1 TusE/DsrC/DsvC family sulfur relay protein [Bacteroidales bacterium]